MEGVQRRPVADADDARPGQPLPEAGVEAAFGLLVQRRRGLVQEDPGGLPQEDPGEGQPLLLAGRQRLGPGAFLVQPPGELRQVGRLQRLRLAAGSTLRRVGMAQRGLQRAERQVGFLRQEHRRIGGHAHRPLPKGQMPASARKKVLFPDPEGPRRMTVRPGASRSLSAS